MVALTPRVLLALPVIFAGSTARADGEQALSVSLGYSTFSTPGKKMGNQEPPAITPDGGGALAVLYERSVSTDFSLRGEAVGNVYHGGTTPMQSSWSGATLVDAGALFRFDVLTDVPYIFAGIGGVFPSGGPIDHGANFVVVLGGGLDILSSRKRSWGFEARLASFGSDVTIFTIGMRETWRWGYF